jgi:hypothetical protein
MSISTYLRLGEDKMLLQHLLFSNGVQAELNIMSRRYSFYHPKHGIIYECDSCESHDTIFNNLLTVLQMLLLFSD